MKGEINAKAAIDKLNTVLKELRNDPVDPNITKEEIKSVKKELGKVQLLALKMKLKPSIQECYNTTPDISSRDLVIHLLGTLSKDTPSELLPPITNHILETWAKLSKKMAA